MITWRERTAPESTVERDLQALLEVTFPFAQDMIHTEGHCAPYGVVLNDRGEGEIVAASPVVERSGGSDEVLDILRHGLERRTNELRAIALVDEVRTDEGDAIRIEVEHRDGPALTVTYGVRRQRLGGTVTYTPPEAEPTEHRFW